MKVCQRCQESKPETDFNWYNRERGIRQTMCRDCFSAYNRARYEKFREQIKADVRDYRLNNPAQVLKTRLGICSKNPTQRNAYKAVEQAIKAGVLTRPQKCATCGGDASEHRVEAHHHDYSAPLDVVWMCTPCHRAVHMSMAKRGITLATAVASS